MDVLLQGEISHRASFLRLWEECARAGLVLRLRPYRPKCPSVRKREIAEQIDSNHDNSILETKQPKLWAVNIILLYY